MITNSHINYRPKAGSKCDSSLGNMLFKIAGTIGIATMNGYSYGFPKWCNQEYFINNLPVYEGFLKAQRLPRTYDGFDFGFTGFNYRDNIDLMGEFGTWKYWHHCEGLIRHYFTLKPQCKVYKNTILIHYRDYIGGGHTSWAKMSKKYYRDALKLMPERNIIVVTDNIDAAYDAIGLDVQYTSNTPIIDFYILANADYLIMANSSFSWWAAFLSGARTIAPKNWYADKLKDAPTNEMYYPTWTII